MLFRSYGIPLIGMASNPASKLIAASDVALVLPKAQEACPMGLAPTTSTTLMLALGDALAVALMERRGFSTDQYRDLHPGGSLGRQLVLVKDIMHTGAEVPLVAEAAAMREVLIEMAARRFGCVGVLDGKETLAGIITDGDLRRHMDKGLLERTAREIMTVNPKVIGLGQFAAEALTEMNDHNITTLFVVDPEAGGGRPAGILHIHDCLRAGLR